MRVEAQCREEHPLHLRSQRLSPNDSMSVYLRKSRRQRVAHTTPDGVAVTVEAILDCISLRSQGDSHHAYVAQMVLVVQVVSYTRTVRVRVGVGAVTVVVVLALPEYAVTGGGVLIPVRDIHVLDFLHSHRRCCRYKFGVNLSACWSCDSCVR